MLLSINTHTHRKKYHANKDYYQKPHICISSEAWFYLSVATGSHKITETYEDQFCESKDHHYDGILPTSTTAGSIIKLNIICILNH